MAQPAQSTTDLVERVAAAIEDAVEPSGKWTVMAEAAIAAHIEYLNGDLREVSADASELLEGLAERAGAEAVIDAPWWAALASMLLEGWRILPPPKVPR